jgi:hypothetical protein
VRGLNWYENIGMNGWAISMANVQYNNIDIKGNLGGKKAYIDTSVNNIQFPEEEFSQIKRIL